MIDSHISALYDLVLGPDNQYRVDVQYHNVESLVKENPHLIFVCSYYAYSDIYPSWFFFFDQEQNLFIQFWESKTHYNSRYIDSDVFKGLIDKINESMSYHKNSGLKTRGLEVYV